MAKDYAKQYRSNHREQKHQNKRKWLIICLILACCFLIDLIIQRKSIYAFYQHSRLASFLSKQTEPKTLVKKEVPAEAIHFDFYKELSSNKLTIADIVEKTQPVNKEYIIQLGLFNNNTEANSLKLSVLLAGYEANILKIKIAKQDYFRVQLGPYSKAEVAKNIQQKLEKTGIIGEIQG